MKHHTLSALTLILALLLTTTPVYAQDADLSTELIVNIFFIAVAAILVFIMQAGFALLESGMVRSKNSVNVMMKNYIDLCVVMIVYWAFGYALMWGENTTGLIGTTGFFFSSDDPLITINMLYQTMFAATAATIISGALAERINFVAYILISVFVCGFIYPVFGSWAWAEGGWLKAAGFIDFAGSTVVHSTGGWVAFAAAVVLGPRLGRFGRDGSKRQILGHNLTLVALSGFFLWFGWFGFNMGSVGKIDGSISSILLNTNLAGAAGGIGGVLTMLVFRMPLLLTSTVVASIGGLVAITAGAATMSTPFAVLTGFTGGAIAVLGISALDKLGVDDAVGAVPCHAFAGFWGTLAAGLFYHDDMFNTGRIIVQLAGAVACMLWAFFGALIIFSIFNKIKPLRVSSGDERRGLDYSEHYELAYPEFQETMLNPGKQQDS